MKYQIKDKTGRTTKCEVSQLEYNGEFMGACSVTCTVKSDKPIDFKIGDYLEYRGERFEINYDPTLLKKSSKGSHGEAFVYDGVKLNSLTDELTRCDFLDYVKSDNNIHFTSLPIFSFYARSIQDLADRIQVNLDRIYKGADAWVVDVHPDYVNTKNVNISVNNLKVWDALALANTQFKANFVIRGRKITIGTAGIAVDKMFKYGKGNGLREIERTADSEQQIVTRLRAYGSTRNLPNRYYNKLSTGVPDNMAVMNLMLPGFPGQTLDPYIDSQYVGILGIREGSVFFDGSTEDLPEIYPSLEGMTAEDLKAAGVYVSATGALDEVLEAEQINDDGLAEENAESKQATFTITLKDIGFDINDYLTGETAKISMTSGMCGGREFEITEIARVGSGYQLTCNRAKDDGLNLYFPYKYYNIQSGDKLVLLGITMPDVYIKAASQRLLEAAKEYLKKNEYVRYTYEPKVDDIYMARQHDEATALGKKSIHDTIKEGDLMLFEDDDLGVSGSIIIDSLSIKEGDGCIPQYTVILKEEKSVGAIEKLQNQIDSIAGGQGGGGYTAEQIRSLIKTYGELLFLSKTRPDQTNHLLKLLGGIISPYLESPDFVPGAMGAGYTIKTNADGQSYAEVDKLLVRMKAVFQTLSIMETELAGADFLFNSSGARAKIAKVEVIEKKRLREKGGKPLLFNGGKRAYSSGGTQGSTVYRCYFLTDDGDTAIENRFRPGNLVRSQTFNIKAGVHENVSNHYWWRMVTDTGKDWIELSDVYCDTDSDIPKVDDVMVQLGDTADTDYQSAIALSAYGDGAPSLTFYTGINSYSLSGKDVFTIAYDRVAQECYVKSYGRFYAGDREETNFVKYTKENGLEIKAKRFLFSNGEDIETRIEATEGRISLKLRETGIDIESGNVTVTADKFKVQGANGTPVAVFTNVGGVPKLRAENIDVDNLNVKNITGGHGKLGNVTIVEGTIGGFEIKGTFLGASKDGIGLHISNSWVSIREDDISVGFGKDALGSLSNIRAIGLFVNNVVREYPTADANVAVYIEASGVEYKDLDTYAWNGNHALYIPKGDICGFRLRTRRMGESGALDKMDSIIMAVKKDMTLDLLSNVEDGQTYFIRNHTNGDVNIRGYISDSGNTDTGYKTIAIARGDLAILIYDKYNSVYTFNYAGRK